MLLKKVSKVLVSAVALDDKPKKVKCIKMTEIRVFKFQIFFLLLLLLF